mgnify:CR=1 FL=1
MELAPHTNDNAGAGPTPPPILLAALVTALVIAAADILIAFPRSPESWPTLEEMLPAMAAAALTSFVSFLLAWYGILRGLARRWNLQPQPLASATAVFFGASFALLSAEGLLGAELLGWGGLLRGTVSLVATSALARATYQGLTSPATSPFLVRWGGGLCRLLPAALLLAVLAACYWNPRRDPQLAPPGGAALAGAALLAVFGVLAWRSSSRTLTRLAAGAFVLLLGAGAVALWNRDNFVKTQTELSAPGSPAVRHVILISADSLRADALSAYGAGGAHTPNLDRLAADAALFRHAYTTASWTLPSTASLLTGLPSFAHEVFWISSRLADEIPTIADLMTGAGYRTAAVTDNPVLDPRLNLYKGFQEYAHYPRPWPWRADAAGRRLLARLAPSRYHRGGTEEVTRAARNWVDRRRDEPFFLWVHYFDPHAPYSPPERFLPDGEAPPRIGTSFDQHVEVVAGTRLLTPDERAWVRRLYLAEVRYLDEQVGLLIEDLKRLGLYEEALIVFTSDHGEEFWEHGFYQHGHSMYNEVVSVPLLVKFPGAAHKGVYASRVSTEFILPTIAELCGLRPQRSCSNAPSLAAIAAGLASDDAPTLVQAGTCYQEELEAVIFGGDYKLIRRLGTQREELFDLRTDPNETRCLLASLPATAEAGRRALAELRERYRQVRACYQPAERQAPAAGRERLRQLRSLGYLN